MDESGVRRILVSFASLTKNRNTDQITDQNTPYCDELRYAVSNDIRVLAVIQRRD